MIGPLIRIPVLAAAMLGLAYDRSASADVIEFTQKAQWEAVAGSFTTIDFTGFPAGTIIVNQYADLGVLFTDGFDVIVNTPSFVNDEWGLNGDTAIHISFDVPQLFIAVDFPGGLQAELYCDGQLLYTSSEFGGSGAGHFAGFASSEPFDEVVLTDWVGNQVAIDDLHFAVPTPGALALMALAGCAGSWRRRG